MTGWVIRVVSFIIGVGLVFYFLWDFDQKPICTRPQIEEGGTASLQRFKDGSYNLLLEDGTVCKVMD